MVKLWFNNNFLELHIEKTIIFNYKVIDHSKLCISQQFINCTCKAIDKEHNIKYFGLNIDCQLKWKAHIDDLISIVRQFYFVIRNTRDIFIWQKIYEYYISLL